MNTRRAGFGPSEVARRGSTPRRLSFKSVDLIAYEYLERVVAYFGGCLSEAARAIGMHRRTLQRNLMKARPNK